MLVISFVKESLVKFHHQEVKIKVAVPAAPDHKRAAAMVHGMLKVSLFYFERA